jgi:hypothetical protein
MRLKEDNPTAATLERERGLIQGLDTARSVKADVLAVAVTVGLLENSPRGL